MEGVRGSTIHISSLNLPSLTIAEIGVRDGINAVRMLEHLDIKRLYLIDPYTTYMDGEVYRGEDEQFGYYREMIENIEPYFKKTVLVNQPSVMAAKLFPDRYFDVVYIDGNHSYESVMEDMATWWDKVKPGGHLTGHDYTKGWYDKDGNIMNVPGVIRAVTEFADRMNVIPTVFSDTDWLIKKV